MGRIARAVATSAALVLALGGLSSAQVTTQGGGSMLIFPRVVADGTWDTAIQIGNAANRPLYARCFYIDGQLTNPAEPAGPLNPPLWAQTDFEIYLTRQQPTHWIASRGRPLDPSEPTCRLPDVTDCDGAGFDPGLIPPVVAGFTGELRCIELDASGAPWSGNALQGVATLTHRGSGEVVTYTAIGVAGFDSNDADTSLCLGGNARDGCTLGAEYGACPQSWILSHHSDADDRPIDGELRTTAITVVPCSENYLTQVPTAVTLQFKLTNELEQTFSAATTITCWADLELSQVNPVFSRDSLGTEWVQTQVRSAARSGGVAMVQHSRRQLELPPTFAASGFVPQHQGVQTNGESVELPAEVLR